MPDHKLSLEEVRHVAKLARLALPDDKLQKISGQLAGILGYIDKMAEVDTSGVDPMAQPLPVFNVLRDDTPGEPLPLEKVLQNAPDADAPFFKVPKVIGGDEDSAG
jgi:aspartyl-tRNA(Asn)/glutamyl-tRNA(Gln) amidotransferase subunit C